MVEEQPTRSYSGKVTAVIVLAIVVVFVVLNVLAERHVPQPDRPVPPPTVVTRSAPP